MQQNVVKGYLEGLEGAFVVGWAFSTLHSNCIITVVDESGKVLADGLACIERPDLKVLGLGRCNIAFRILVPELGNTRHLHVLADGVDLTHSPLAVGERAYDGGFDVHHGMVDGWVAERREHFEPPRIVISDQSGRVVFTSESQLAGKTGGKDFRAAHFSGPIDHKAFGCGELRLSAYADNVKFAEQICDLPLTGNIEVLTGERCVGWLVSAAAPQRQLDIEVFRNGTFVALAKCELPREDVRGVVQGATRCGFDISLPSSRTTPLDTTTLSFRLPGSDIDLFEGPYVLAPRPALVLAARRLAGLAHASPDASLTSLERAVLADAMAEMIAKARRSDRALVFNRQGREPARMTHRLNVVIPIYRDAEVTRACIDSVIRHRDAQLDRIVLVNDRSPDKDMEALLWSYLDRENIFLLINEVNLGFVKSSNRGIAFCPHGDVILLNSDTKVFAGGLEELWRVANSSPDIGTATALSNNATIFSYPHMDLRRPELDDAKWSELAAVALDKNRGVAIDVPTGHGFCMLIKQDVLRHVGKLDESFGRGYGEENDLCARAADLGYRNVVAPGALVEHRESISFVGEKLDLLAVNLPKLEQRYPEYTEIIIEAQRRDDLRRARWALDGERLRRASGAGHFILTVRNELGGGTKKAIKDIEAAIGLGSDRTINLVCREDGVLELSADRPLIRAVFSPHEVPELMAMLAYSGVVTCVVHQVLGFPADFIDQFGVWLGGINSIFYAHDFYPICPRVTLIDALGQFCGVPSVDVCNRCVEIGGSHEASRLTELQPAEHRALFGKFLSYFRHIVAPSANAAGYLKRVFPELDIEPLPHPELPFVYPEAPRQGDADEIILLGAIGPHKGSAQLCEIAKLARLRSPSLRFRVIGYTDRDAELRRIGNVEITGPYSAKTFGDLVARSTGRFALFLSIWPETFSYTLSEAVSMGFIPLVPDIGAPADRVRSAGFGAVFPFPIVATEVLDFLHRIANGQEPFTVGGAGPDAFATGATSAQRTKAMIFPTPGGDLD